MYPFVNIQYFIGILINSNHIIQLKQAYTLKKHLIYNNIH